MTPAADLVPLLRRPLVALDVGCRWGIPDGWDALLPDALSVYAFDADPEECRRLQADAPVGVTYVPHGLSDEEGEATLHVTAQPACSSLFAPAPGINGRTPALRDDTRKVGEMQVPMRTMDAWAKDAGVERADVLKLDVQGAELLVLRGGPELLRTARLIELEVIFNPIYTGQGLFGDVDALLRSHGFELWHLGQLVHYSADWQDEPHARTDVHYFDSRPSPLAATGGQTSWAHAFYCAPEYLDGSWADPADAARDALAARLLGIPELEAHATRGAGLVPASATPVEVAPVPTPEPVTPAEVPGPTASDGPGAAEFEAELARVREDRDALHAELARVREDRDRLHAALATGGGAADAVRRRVSGALRGRRS